MEVVLYPNEILRRRCNRITAFKRKALRAITDDMFDVMDKYGGVGLAAPQVGLTKRIFVMRTDLLEEVVINPSWRPSKVAKRHGQVTYNEACLSFPNLVVRRKRWVEIMVNFYDIKGRSHTMSLEGLEAHVFQHETDHLNGRLLIDGLTNHSNPQIQLGGF